MTEGPIVGGWRARGWAAGLAVLVLSAAVTLTGMAAEPDPAEPRTESPSAERLFQRDCAVCHGPAGDGTNRGPSIRDAGTAGVHFMLTTGYMPLNDPDEPLERKEPAYTPDQIAALVAYADRFVSGPTVPDVLPRNGLVARGGELYRLHCAQCHQFLGTGGILIGSTSAPTLHHSTAIEVVEAIRVGPGTMPPFSEEQLSDEEAEAIASFVELEVQHPRDEGGLGLGHFGPWSEGFIAWLIGIGGLVSIAAWIGKRT